MHLAAEGRSIPEALAHLQDWAAREELFFAYTRFVVIGEAAAREGLEDILDIFQRNIQTRLSLPVFLVREGTARELVTNGGDALYEITSALSALQRDLPRLFSPAAWAEGVPPGLFWEVEVQCEILGGEQDAAADIRGEGRDCV